VALRNSHRGATRLGFTDVLVVAIVTSILLFAAWEQFPAYNRAFAPRRILSPASSVPKPGAIDTPNPRAASQP
jgi:hypothetical protein